MSEIKNYPPRRTTRKISVETQSLDKKTPMLPASYGRLPRKKVRNSVNLENLQSVSLDSDVALPQNVHPLNNPQNSFTDVLTASNGEQALTPLLALQEATTPVIFSHSEYTEAREEDAPEENDSTGVYSKKITEQQNAITPLSPLAVIGRNLKKVVIALLVFLLVSYASGNLLLKHYYVSSGSMFPTMETGARLIEVLPFVQDEVVRGQIVIFEDLDGWMPSDSELSDKLVKRVIGLPGDTVSGNSRGELSVNGIVLEEPYLNHSEPITYIDFTVTVPDGRYFVMGDNRLYSSDSREYIDNPYYGTIPRDSITGTPDYVADNPFNPGQWTQLITPEEVFANIP